MGIVYSVSISTLHYNRVFAIRSVVLYRVICGYQDGIEH